MSTYWSAFTLPLNETLRRIISFVPRIFVAFVLFLLFYLLAQLVRRLLRRSLAKVHHLPGSVRILIARSAYIVVLVIGFMVALSAANVDVTAIVASLGVAGFALGFALKDILENFIAGILLLFARPFEIGDQVTVAGFEGTVIDIEIRNTTLRTYADERVSIPNSQIFTSPVTNHTAMGKRRYVVPFDTSVSADAAQVQTEALKVVRENEAILHDPAPFIRVASVDSGNDILSWNLYYWAAPTKAVEIATKSTTLEQLKAVLYDAGVPTPTATSATILHRSAQPPTARIDQ